MSEKLHIFLLVALLILSSGILIYFDTNGINSVNLFGSQTTIVSPRIINADEAVYGVSINQVIRAYREYDLNKDKDGILIDTINGAIIAIVKHPNGYVDITRADTGEKIPFVKTNWGEWRTKYTYTSIYGFSQL